MFKSNKNRIDLTKTLTNKFNGEIPTEKVLKIINFIILWIIDQLLNKKTVIIKGFGFFIPHQYTVREFFDIYSNKIEPKKTKTTIRFHATKYLKVLLHNKKEYFTNGK